MAAGKNLELAGFEFKHHRPRDASFAAGGFPDFCGIRTTNELPCRVPTDVHRPPTSRSLAASSRTIMGGFAKSTCRVNCRRAQ